MANNLVDLNVGLSGNARQYLDVVAEETADLANAYVAKASKNARGQAQDIEGSVLNIGRGKQYFRSATVSNVNAAWGGLHTTESFWDSKTKVYRTKNRLARRKKGQKGDSGYLRLENFSFRKAAGSKKKDNFQTTAEARLTSNLANLHENDVKFPKGSIKFSNGFMSKWRRFYPGQTRRGKKFFDKYAAAVYSTLPKSEEEALSQWGEAIRRNTKGL